MTQTAKGDHDIVEQIVVELRKQRRAICEIRNGQLIIHIAQGQPEPVKVEAHYRLN